MAVFVGGGEAMATPPLRIFIATWNVGNAEPDHRLAFLPPLGVGYDVICVGCQESTYHVGTAGKRVAKSPDDDDYDNLDDEEDEGGGVSPHVEAAAAMLLERSSAKLASHANTLMAEPHPSKQQQQRQNPAMVATVTTATPRSLAPAVMGVGTPRLVPALSRSPSSSQAASSTGVGSPTAGQTDHQQQQHDTARRQLAALSSAAAVLTSLMAVRHAAAGRNPTPTADAPPPPDVSAAGTAPPSPSASAPASPPSTARRDGGEGVGVLNRLNQMARVKPHTASSCGLFSLVKAHLGAEWVEVKTILMWQIGVCVLVKRWVECYCYNCPKLVRLDWLTVRIYNSLLIRPPDRWWPKCPTWWRAVSPRVCLASPPTRGALPWLCGWVARPSCLWPPTWPPTCIMWSGAT